MFEERFVAPLLHWLAVHILRSVGLDGEIAVLCSRHS